MARELTADMLRQTVSYCPSTGEFRWLRDFGNQCRSGAVAGCSNPCGYRSICIGGKHYKAHRLAWFYVHGVWPSVFIDHIDGNRSNNALSNLREADAAQNQKNRVGKGYSFDPRYGKYQAKICVDGRRISLGLFPDEDSARSAYLEAHLKFHGEYSVVHRVAS